MALGQSHFPNRAATAQLTIRTPSVDPPRPGVRDGVRDVRIRAKATPPMAANVLAKIKLPTPRRERALRASWAREKFMSAALAAAGVVGAVRLGMVGPRCELGMWGTVAKVS
jgi:hypothetical protein